MSASVTRWRRYGKDRLYVTAEDGTKLGHVDLVAGSEHLDEPSREAEFRVVVETWRATEALAVQQPSVADALPAVELPPVPEQRQVAELGVPAAAVDPARSRPADDEDLAARRAGAMAREQAVALKQAAPVRTFLARALGVHTDERAWRIGADGEEKVAAQLNKLAKKDPRWRFLHAIPVGENGSDIDHLVVGPGGVYSLNAKHHPGAKVWVGGNTLMVNGQRQPYIRNSRHEAARASRLLTAACGFVVNVTGVVVPVGAHDVIVKVRPDQVHVVYRKALARWLRDRPAGLGEAEVESIFEAARRSSTWKVR